jgi:toxin ParE1/3/4
MPCPFKTPPPTNGSANSWSARALADVEAIAAYVACDSPSFANPVTRKTVTLTRTLREFPLSSRKVPEFDDENIRELIANSYRMIYRVDGALVTAAAIVPGKRILE